MTAPKEMEYSVLLCPGCKYFRAYASSGRKGWCTAWPGPPKPVIKKGDGVFLQSAPCTRRKIKSKGRAKG